MAGLPHYANTTLAELEGGQIIPPRAVGPFMTLPYRPNPIKARKYRLIGWPEEAKVLQTSPIRPKERKEALPEVKATVETLVNPRSDPRLANLPHPSRSPTSYGTTPREFASHIISEQDADIADEKEYLGYVSYLLKGQSKYNVFRLLYPGQTSNVEFTIGSDDQVHLQGGTLEELRRDVATRMAKGFGTSLSFDNHANALWFQGHEVWRYEPHIPGPNPKNVRINGALSRFFAENFKTLTFVPHTLEDFYCVQDYRGKGRRYKADYFCQDYSLLYLIRRLSGFDHEEAAFDLVARADEILEELKELLLDLAIIVRKAEVA